MERILRSIFDNYLSADERCRDLARPEKANLRPFYRRALIEGSLRAIAAQFPETVTAEAVRYKEKGKGKEKGFWYHTRVICNHDVVLTQNAIAHPDIVVRHSCFRNEYSEPDNVRYLLPVLQSDHEASRALLYGIILHGRAPTDSVLFPGFAQVRFPTRGLTGYHDGRIDLFKEFPEVCEEKTTGLPGVVPEEAETEPELIDPSDLPGEDEFGAQTSGG